MCQYCNFKFEENGDCWDVERTIDHREEQFGLGKLIFRTNMFVRPLKKDVTLNFEVSTGGNIEDLIFDNYIPIKYCPFCGRKLTFPDEEVEKCPKQENTTQ